MLHPQTAFLSGRQVGDSRQDTLVSAAFASKKQVVVVADERSGQDGPKWERPGDCAEKLVWYPQRSLQ
jgi:hypothetical protein